MNHRCDCNTPAKRSHLHWHIWEYCTFLAHTQPSQRCQVNVVTYFVKPRAWLCMPQILNDENQCTNARSDSDGVLPYPNISQDTYILLYLKTYNLWERPVHLHSLPFQKNWCDKDEMRSSKYLSQWPFLRVVKRNLGIKPIWGWDTCWKVMLTQAHNAGPVATRLSVRSTDKLLKVCHEVFTNRFLRHSLHLSLVRRTDHLTPNSCHKLSQMMSPKWQRFLT